LVGDLLDIVRVQAGRLELHLAPTDLAAVVREAVEEQRQVNPERALVLEWPAEARVPVTAGAEPRRAGGADLSSQPAQILTGGSSRHRGAQGGGGTDTGLGAR